MGSELAVDGDRKWGRVVLGVVKRRTAMTRDGGETRLRRGKWERCWGVVWSL